MVDAASERLVTLLAKYEGLAVAFSGGVDSSVLLHAAHATLGARAVGVLADSPSLPRSELTGAKTFADSIGVRLIIVETSELADPRYRANAGDRCYFCKHALFSAMQVVCSRLNLPAMAFGEIVDDLADDRPGARAAEELEVLAPLRLCGFSKVDVRDYARVHGLAVAEKPASACLASRLPRGTTVTRERLARVEAAEEQLRAMGLSVLRVRDHGQRARVEVGALELEGAMRLRRRIEAALAEHGFSDVELATYRNPTDVGAGSPS